VTRLVSRLARRAARGGLEAGAVMVEFAIILPILVALTFGILEFSSAYHDSSITADATRAGGRVGSALATNPAYATSVVNAVNSALKTLPSNSPQELWIYKANSRGYPGSTDDFSSCTSDCIKYRWNSSTRTFDTSNPGGNGWPASRQQVCTQPFDEIGVYVKVDHKFLTRLFGAHVTLADHSVFRFEPVPTSVCSS
jgi:Flp pilus assembly protein TadG